MRKLFVIIAGLGLSFSTVQAQKISGMVTDEPGKGLDKTTVALLRAKRFFCDKTCRVRR
jgi:hypothetical protein